MTRLGFLYIQTIIKIFLNKSNKKKFLIANLIPKTQTGSNEMKCLSSGEKKNTERRLKNYKILLRNFFAVATELN